MSSIDLQIGKVLVPCCLDNKNYNALKVSDIQLILLLRTLHEEEAGEEKYGEEIQGSNCEEGREEGDEESHPSEGTEGETARNSDALLRPYRSCDCGGPVAAHRWRSRLPQAR